MSELYPIPGYEGLYSIRKNGTIISHYTGKERVVTLGKRGYFVVDLIKDKKRKNEKLHRLLAITFLPNPKSLPLVNHIDGNKLNNSLGNLEWCTTRENNLHAVKTGLRKPKYGSSDRNGGLDEIKALVIHTFKKSHYGNTKMASEVNSTQPTVCLIRNGKRWPHFYRYSEDSISEEAESLKNSNYQLKEKLKPLEEKHNV